MTPTHTDSPLRRSEVGAFRSAAQTPVINDDEEERREARRRTVFDDTSTSSTIEDNETLKNCLRIYTENKLSKENAWSVSLIDTLSSLLDKHHKSLNNFKVAGSSLEASSKVYSLRVDCIHRDVLRLTSGLTKYKFVEEDENEEDTSSKDVEARPEGGEQNPDDQVKVKPKKRTKKAVSTITKNKDTINGKLDTNPFTDPIFARINAISASLSSSTRLLQNILPSTDSELRLKMDFKFWDSEPREPITYPAEHDYSNAPMVDVKRLCSLKSNDLYLRTIHTGYIISDTPAEEDEDEHRELFEDSNKENNNSQLAVAFDINAEVEPIATDTAGFVDVDMGELDELTVEDQAALRKCRGLRRAPVIIEDLRPIDSTSSNLEYSYRPLDQISQFWAGPSHWKFRKPRNKSLSLAQRFSVQPNENQKSQNQRARQRAIKFRTQHIQFGKIHDDLFQKLDGKCKLKKANIKKKWDAKKFKLPTDLQIDKNIFDVYKYAPGISVYQEMEEIVTPELEMNSNYNYSNPVEQEYCGGGAIDDYTDNEQNEPMSQDEIEAERTVLEIATDFVGAPDKITKIVVPFQKRAKVVDMKQLKKCCMHLINKQLEETDKPNMSPPPALDGEKYKGGVASFVDVYKKLPNVLSSKMNDALSISVALYSVLHLANESNLRLMSQEDLEDIKLRQLDN